MALVITMLVLIMLTFVGTASFFNASVDVKITGNQKGSGQSLYAAEAGMADMIDSLNEFQVSGVGEGSGTPTIKYSCEALDTYIPSGKFDHKLAWERL